jgi:GDP-D-mannose dehydratase
MCLLHSHRLSLAEFHKGYEVIRRVAIEDPEHRLWRLRHILDKLVLHAASLESFASILNVVDAVQPDQIHHLAAQSFVSYSFEDEFSTIGTNINGTRYVLAATIETKSSQAISKATGPTIVLTEMPPYFLTRRIGTDISLFL